MVQSLIWIPLTNFPLPHYFIHQNHKASILNRILCVLEPNLRKALLLMVGKGVKGHQHGLIERNNVIERQFQVLVIMFGY